MRKISLVLLAVVLLAAQNVAMGAIVVSGELQYGDPTARPGAPYYGPTTIDRVTFDVTAGTAVNFDTLAWENSDLNGDGELTRVDIQITLFNSSNVVLSGNDDGPLGSDGSVTGLDSNMNYTFAVGGTYFLTLGTLSYSPTEAPAGSEPDNFHWGRYENYISNTQTYAEDHADWQLTMTPTNGTISNVRVSTAAAAVPEPSSLAIFGIGAIIAGLGVARRRKST